MQIRQFVGNVWFHLWADFPASVVLIGVGAISGLILAALAGWV